MVQTRQEVTMRFGTFSYNQARPDVQEAQAFEELLEQVELTDHLGFDEAWFAEHHHSDYGLLASPNLIIAALARRTHRLRLGGLVNVLPLHDPIRLAEECAMLDILTEGRLNVGLGRGVPRDDIKHGLDVDTARARFSEGVEVLLKAWTGGTFSHDGPTWTYRDISCRPQPIQSPHPPIYYGAGSPESAREVARKGWNLAMSRQPLTHVAAITRAYREERASARSSAPGSVLLARDIYVAETDEQAWAEAGPEIVRFWQLATDNVWKDEPISMSDLSRFTSRFAYYDGGLTEERLTEWGVSLVGSPQTVRRGVRRIVEEAAPDSLVGLFAFGNLRHEQVLRSIQLFADEVMPSLANEPVGAQADH
jgi:alkanesulfonate monooxygenase SsuD/methylene tetrahydromethanopterin reductase-like flavin-dependent oxidoreductase (luciferase family)